MKYFRVTDGPEGIPIPWKTLPGEIKNELPGDLMWNVKTVDKDGRLGEATVVYLRETDEEPDEPWDIIGKLGDDLIIFNYDDLC